MTQSAAFAPLLALRSRDTDARFAELDADTMPTLHALKLDMKRCAYVGSKSDLTCWLIDVDRDGRKREPAMLLANKVNPSRYNTFVVLSELWLLIDPDFPDDPAMTRAARAEQRRALHTMSEQLYGFALRDAGHRVLDAVFDFAEDIKNAKPPQWMTHAQWLQALAEDDMTMFEHGIAVNR